MGQHGPEHWTGGWGAWPTTDPGPGHHNCSAYWVEKALLNPRNNPEV